ncbi:MAG: ABC transporter ATP-binding protein [Firmicutes bacterium]|nr:ABC transporter ATP-binding protein [Bacillota bacterium]
MIKTINLSKDFAGAKALEKLNLHIAAGELFGFLGPNGAGKTTTIKMLTGLLRPTAGEIIINGYDIKSEPVAAKSCLGFVPDEPILYEKLSGREFLSFMADLYKVGKKDKEERIPELLQLFSLAERADDYIQSYSRGMRRKIAIAGALIHNPRVLLLDEPTLGLDPASARLLKDILRTLVSRGAAVFMSTHILEIAQHMCTRVGIINQGELIACGTMDQLRSQAQEYSLEDVFLKLTGGVEHRDTIRFLREGVE